MTELENKTVSITYSFYFGDKEQGLYTKCNMSGQKILSDEEMQAAQNGFIKAMSELGSFQPVSLEEYEESQDEE
ncbi:MAG: hypothetical protein SOY76_02370 [Veillonella caviae]|nr:hypothetical protein [Veillonella caviae]